MLVDEGTLLFGVALKADRILRGRSHPYLIGKRRTMHVVAVAALNQPFVDAMMKRHFELRFLLQMAGVAKLRLRLRQQELARLGMVRGMARNATHSVLGVDGIEGVHMLSSPGVTRHAAIGYLLAGSILEGKNLRHIAATFYVSRAWTVTALASLV